MAKVKNKAKKKRSSVQIAKPDLKKKVINPFEIHVNRQKYEVLGRRTKNDKGLPGISKAKAIKKRKNTLLQEYKVRDKSNKFLDRRIGEKNRAMTSEDRIMARFTAERMKMHNKKMIFNLADDEILTHRGQSLSEIEKFDDPRSDDEEDHDKLGAEFVEDAHFGGGVLRKSDNTETNRKNLIEQLIAESKKRKAEQQKAREQTIELTEKLDTEWKDLLPIVSASKKSLNNEIEDEKPDSYDTVMRQLKFEARGKPSDRLKSEEELAKEEKERLEKLEAERLQRMHGVKGLISEAKHKSADDLDDGFEIESDEEAMMTYNADGQLENPVSQVDVDEQEIDESKSVGLGDEEPDNADDKSEEGSSSSSDEDGDDSDNLSDLKNTSESEDEELEKEKPIIVEQKKDENSMKADLLIRKEMMELARKELPYTFKVPESYEELQTLLNGQSYEHQAVILERMIKCNHPSLGEGLKDKLANLFAFLLQHLQDTAASSKLDETHNCFALLDRLAPYLYDLCHMSPQNAGRCMSEVIREKQQDFRKRNKVYPGFDTLVFLKLVSLLFPTSDFRHPVVTPALVFMCQMLNQCRIKMPQDIAIGMFLTTLMLEYTVLSKRFSPSVINFLCAVLDMAVPRNNEKLVRAIHPVYISPTARTLLVPEQSLAENVSDIGLMTIDDMRGKNVGDSFKLRTFYTAVKLLQEFCENLKNSTVPYQIFQPVFCTLKKIDTAKYPTPVLDDINKLILMIEVMGQQNLQFLVVAKKKPKALRLYEPKIEVVLDRKHRRPMGKAKQEREKLLHKYKREMKGAVREIRRDKSFLAKLKLKQTLKDDFERKQKVKEIFGSASMQQGELRKLKRKKK